MISFKAMSWIYGLLDWVHADPEVYGNTYTVFVMFRPSLWLSLDFTLNSWLQT